MLSGTDCSFVASSGGVGRGTEEEQQPPPNLVIIVDGQLVDGPVEGVQFESGSLSGETGPNGEFQFEDGEEVRFFIGDIALGRSVPAKPLMSPVDLVPGGDLNNPEVINIARLLQSLDSIRDDERITIPRSVRSLANLRNPEIGSILELLDLSDSNAFANSGSQLVASLTGNYTFTTNLVDADTARQHMRTSLWKFGLIER